MPGNGYFSEIDNTMKFHCEIGQLLYLEFKSCESRDWTFCVEEQIKIHCVFGIFPFCPVSLLIANWKSFGLGVEIAYVCQSLGHVTWGSHSTDSGIFYMPISACAPI